MSQEASYESRIPTDTFKDLVGILELVLTRVDYQPLSVDELELTDGSIVSGSVRMQTGYDSVAKSMITLMEVFALTTDMVDPTPHRVIADWDDGRLVEVDLDTKTVFLDADMESLESEAKSKVSALQQGIMALLEDAI